MADLNDMVLICRAGLKVAASSKQLMDASLNIAFKEIVSTAMAERQGEGLAKLRELDDDSGAWCICIKLLRNANTEALTWGTLLGVLQVADKYELRAVLEACQDRITTHVLGNAMERPRLYAVLAGREPWNFINMSRLTRAVSEAEVNVDVFIKIAVQLHNSGLMIAYRAMVGNWVGTIVKMNEKVRCGNVEAKEHMLSEFKLRAEKIGKSLITEVSCPARRQLLSDIFLAYAHRS